jgi:hypothetical protein
MHLMVFSMSARVRRTGAILLIGVVSAAACTTEEAVPPGSRRPVDSTLTSTSGSSSTVGTGSTSSPAVTTTPAITDTTIGGTVTTLLEDPPTISADSAGGQPTATPTEYVVGGDPDGWLSLGRWTGSGWEPVTSGSTGSAIASGTTVGVYELGAAPIEATTGTTTPACSDGRTGPSISPNAGAPQDPGFGFRSVAFAADWSPSVRSSATVSATIDAYVEAGRQAFTGTVVDTVDGAISQILVSDLDGDGDSESLVSYGAIGYSALLLIDADSGASLTVARSISQATPTAGSPPVDYDTYRILAVVDMNGDGLMEFLVHSWRGSPPTSTATAYAYDGTTAVAVLSASC